MGGHLRNGRNISVEQQQRELEREQRELTQPDHRQQDSGARAGLVGLQRGDDSLYQLSPAATERLQTFNQKPTFPQQSQREDEKVRSTTNGAGNLASSHQLMSNVFGVRNYVDQIDTGPTPYRTPGIHSPHEYRDRAPDSINLRPLTPAWEGPEDIIVDNPQLETVINLFNDQWLMFVQARENQNVPMMRLALQQAVGSQEVIRNLAGGEEMLRICENWIAREELADLERSEQNNPTPQVQRLAITQ
ncbi:uncharacterized protein PGTG_19606 [Puccinia graminis f. sp. tritici CRL 75-36-700-3]|uniref:Uncharacterized protein n=1 Tax=Puccinia graminis f. sp. tritici (strain CRL 75-36-700-3 / race SCCL) TaxID=418459 RepID=E3LAN2_PUCGT|nr:uncharacterized protein PGTG_19606 [Puccinia graminis f. sp. tritici CRL 75-36-700-3]EFP93607.1 hypothetical protein PGTG_19606 [Puccinia graminis f. sp. tritici CRL 75-36-700-3]